jgi:predicted Rossmann fold flavoprotein
MIPIMNLIKNVITNPRFLFSAFNAWSSESMQNFLKNEGLKLKIERGDRVFPLSNHSSDVIKTLTNACEKRGVKFQYNSTVKEIEIVDKESKKTSSDISSHENDELNNNRFLVKTDRNKYECDRLIICTGGFSYQSTGSTGDGYRFAKNFGHNIYKAKPGLVPFEVYEEEEASSMSGLSLKNVALTLFINNKKIYTEQGEMLFTHFGVSGPLVLSASEYYNKAVRNLEKKGKEVEEAYVLIDLKPALSEEKLDARILRDFEEKKNAEFKNSIHKLLPSGMIPIVIKMADIEPDKKVNSISREERQRLLKVLKNMRFNIKNTRGFTEAIITNGGIDIKQINPRTMESKLVSNMYFAGEVLDVDALTGGFNLQIAWSTGYLAGISAGSLD